MSGRAESSDVLAKESELRAIDSPAAWASPRRSDRSVIDPFGLPAVGPSKMRQSMTLGSGISDVGACLRPRHLVNVVAEVTSWTSMPPPRGLEEIT